MGVPASASDRRALVAGLVVLAAAALVYPLMAGETGRPLAVFVLPGLLTASLGGWRPTVVVGAASLAIAVVVGVLGPLDPAPLAARWSIIVVGLVLGAVGAYIREHQAIQLEELGEAVLLREAFERALAPAPIPPDGVLAIAHYRAAETKMRLGGDFLEAVALADGRLAVLIGDVCGHGPREAAFGAALRAGWKSIALGALRDPAEWLVALDRSFFHDGRVDTFVTVCTGIFDREGQTSSLVNAGHPPPLRLQGSARPMEVPPTTPLGLGPAVRRAATQLPWLGEPVLFYTDGLVENPRLEGPPERWGTDGLRKWLDGHLPIVDPLALVTTLMTDATKGRDVRDDLAVLLVAADERSARGAPFSAS